MALHKGQARAEPGVALCVKQPLVWQLPWTMLADFDLAKKWALSVWRLCPCRSSGDFSPTELVVTSYMPPMSIWKGDVGVPIAIEPEMRALEQDFEEDVGDEGALQNLIEVLTVAEVADALEANPEGVALTRPSKRRRRLAAVAPRMAGAQRRNTSIAGAPASAAALAGREPAEPARQPSSGASQAVQAEGSGPAAASSGQLAEGSAGALVPLPPEPPADIVRAPHAHRPRTVERYPRLLHTAAGASHGESYIRLVDNERLGYKDMRAVCGYHEQCTLSQACRRSRGTPMLGRPLGLLWSFLDRGGNTASKYEHKDLVQRISRAERIAARAHMRGLPEAAHWFDAEEPTGPGEPDEPRKRNEA